MAKNYRINEDRKTIYLDRTKATKEELEDVKYLSGLGYSVKLSKFKEPTKKVKGDKKPLQWFKENLTGKDLELFEKVLKDKSTSFDEKKQKDVKNGGFFNAKKAIYAIKPELQSIELTEEEINALKERAKKK